MENIENTIPSVQEVIDTAVITPLNPEAQAQEQIDSEEMKNTLLARLAELHAEIANTGEKEDDKRRELQVEVNEIDNKLAAYESKTAA